MRSTVPRVGRPQCGELVRPSGVSVRDGGSATTSTLPAGRDSRRAKPQPHRRGRHHAHVEPLAQRLTRFERQRLDRHAVHGAVGDHDESRDRRRKSRHCPDEESPADAAGRRRPHLASRLPATQQAGQCRDLDVEISGRLEWMDGRTCPGNDEHPGPAAKLAVEVGPWSYREPEHRLTLIQRPLHFIERREGDRARRQHGKAAGAEILPLEFQEPQLRQQRLSLGRTGG